MGDPKPSLWERICAGGTETDRRNQRKVQLWMAAWMAAWLGVGASLEFELLPKGELAAVASVATVVLGLFALAAYRRFLLQADELRRKIELDALAVAVGLGVLYGMTCWLLVRAGALAEFDGLWIIVVMLVTHGIGVFVGQRRYS